MKSFLIAASLAAMLPASFAMAEDKMMEPKMMMENETMIEASVASSFKKYGITTNPSTLTIAQLAEIINVMDMSVTGKMAEGDVKASIEAAIARK